MGIYQIDWKSSALRELKRIDRQIVPRIITTVESLSSNPFPSGVKKLHGSESTYRIRVGNYRIIYEVYPNHLIVEIIRVRHRKNVYRK